MFVLLVVHCAMGKAKGYYELESRDNLQGKRKKSVITTTTTTKYPDVSVYLNLSLAVFFF